MIEARILLSAPGVGEDAVWRAYSLVEKEIALLKFRTGFETPGVSSKLPEAGDPPGLLDDAKGLLSTAADLLAEGAVVDAIRTMRKARNDLRSYLLSERKRAKGSTTGGRA